MKALRIILALMLSLASLFAFASCSDDNSTDTSISTDTNTNTNTNIDTDTSTNTKPITRYTVTWKNHDGSVLERDTNVPYGATPTYDGEMPTKNSTAQFTYTFKGWNKKISPVTSNVTYVATYEGVANKYTVIWKNYDGTILEKDIDVPYGATPQYNGEAPTKALANGAQYTFAGWDKAISIVTGNITYVATYNSDNSGSGIISTYTVIWKNYDGSVLETDTNVPYGTMPTYDGSTPTRAPSAGVEYTFTGWNKEIAPVTGDITYVATYNSGNSGSGIISTYTVIWKNYDGSVLETDTNVPYGTMPAYNGSTPTREKDNTYSYTFDSWSPSTTLAITKDTVFTAQYTKKVIDYSSSFTISYDANGGTNAPHAQTKKVNQDLTLSSTVPTREGYTFVGWNNLYESTTYAQGSIYTGNMSITFYAIWEKNCNTCDALGTVTVRESCSTCGGDGIVTNKNTCLNCSGDGTISKDVIKSCSTCGGDGETTPSTYKPCSSCNGYGGDVLCKCSCGYQWWANTTGNRKCSRCGSIVSGTRYNTCSSCSGSGTIKVPGTTCSSCSGVGKWYSTVTNTCTSCNGAGYHTSSHNCATCQTEGYVMVTYTCSDCDGVKFEKVSAPTLVSKDHYVITLAELNGYEYSIDGINWQSSVVFENLRPETTYTLYQRMATNDGTPFGATSAPLTVTTSPLPVYTITYTLNGGSASNPSTYTIESDEIVLAEPTKDGYTFLGWTGTDLDEMAISVAIPTGSYGNRAYTAHWQANGYTISFDVNASGISSISPQNVVYDSSYTLPTPETRVGYTFVGWYDERNNWYINGTWSTPNNVNLIAKWSPLTNIPYIVNHYQQNIENDDYTLYYTQNLTGTADSSVTPKVESYTGFTAPTLQTVNVNPDGSRVVNYYYTRNAYKITVVGNGGTSNSITQKYQSTINTAGWTAREGYTLVGLYTDVGLTAPYSRTTVPAQNETVYAHWEGENKPADFSFTMTNDGIIITGYKGTSTAVNIPTQIGGKSIVAIADSAFKENQKIISLTIPNSIISIGNDAFSGCTSLKYNEYDNAYYLGNKENSHIALVKAKSTDVTTCEINSRTKIVLGNAFDGCSSLTNVIIPDSIISIDSDTFLNCTMLKYNEYDNAYYLGNSENPYIILVKAKSTDIESCEINDKTKFINANAFYGCGYITSITIPDSVNSIGNRAFGFCESLTSVMIPNNVTSIGEAAFFYCTSLKSITIPNSVTSIGLNAFGFCSSLEYNEYDNAYYLGNSENPYVVLIEAKSKDITSCEINNKTKLVYCYAFSGCTSLTSITIGNSVISIGDSAFRSCSALESVTIPNSVTSIGSYAFSGCSTLTSVTIGNSVTTIGDYAFSSTALESVVIPDSVIAIGSYAFSECFSLTNATIGDGVRTIGLGAFYYSSRLTSVTIGNNVVSIGDGAFCATSLTSVTIPDSVISIGDGAFSGCASLTSIIISNNVTSIGVNAFLDCTSLTIYCESTSQPSGWDSSWNGSNRPVYWYSESKPSTSGNYWYYGTDGKITTW